MTAPQLYDEAFMHLALAEARKGRGSCRPNPMVGAVIVKDGVLIATGFHERAGQPHAEKIALARAGSAARGSTVYVNLEPCCHFGRTPPCTDALIAAGVKRVVAGMIDPDDRVSGQGVSALRAAGIEVHVGVLQNECWELNSGFVVSKRQRRPLCTLKFAVSLDGKVATARGSSQWITGEQARARGHELRATHDAILVGRRTVELDDPQLTTRIPAGNGFAGPTPNPHRCVCDPELRLEPNHKVFDTQAAPTTVFCADSRDRARQQALEAKGVQVVVLGPSAPFAARSITDWLHSQGFLSLLIEGGPTVSGSFCDEDLVDRVAVFHAPLIIGGIGALSAVGGRGLASLSGARRGHIRLSEQLGDDHFTLVDFLADLEPPERAR